MIICKITGEMVLAKDSNGWMVADSVNATVDKHGKEQEHVVSPAYFGLHLGNALVYAAKRAAFLKAEPGMTMDGVVELLKLAQADILTAVEGNASELRDAAKRLQCGGA